MAVARKVGLRRIRQVARDRFGFERLRPGQEEAIQAVAGGRDTLAVMPTGSGKSAIYQIAGVLTGGATIVVSPLIALQRDQMEAIEEQDAAPGAVLNSTLRAGERREALEDLREGELEYLLLAPEQFGDEAVLEQVRRARPSLFVVDEAHCISEWGHDFRPEYLRLGAVVEALRHPTVLALTATAAPPVRDEIVERLGMRRPRVVVRGFDRPNIWFGAATYPDERTKRRSLVERVVGAEKPGIVYVATRRQAEEVATALQEDGLRARAYHAGLPNADRERGQDAFMSGEDEVIVATTAFGMGVDKPDVRFVFHLTVSDSVDSYYQEVGRAGRDGAPASAFLFYRPQDLGLRRFFAAGGHADADEVERVARVLEGLEGPVDPDELRERTGLSDTKLSAALNRLDEMDAVDLLPSGDVVPDDDAPGIAEVASEAEVAAERRRALDRSRVDMIRAYAETRSCRRAFLLSYFGEAYEGPCGNCDNDEAEGAAVEAEDGAGEAKRRPFRVGARVVHGQWGEGQVQRYEDARMVVLFDDAGYKTLSVDLVVERKLLSRAR